MMSNQSDVLKLDSIQVKRITSNYNGKKGYVPKEGEFVLIDVDGEFAIPGVCNTLTAPGVNVAPGAYTTKTPFFVIGDGVSSIDTLISGKRVLCGVDVLQRLINKLTDEILPTEAPDQSPQPVKVSSSKGTKSRYARADHVHSIGISTIEDVLGNRPWTAAKHRKIFVGTDTPDPKLGSAGDIYVKYG